MKSCNFFTDTATLCVFDPAALRHRLADSADWWTMKTDQIAEMNLGNVAFVDLGSDGEYTVRFENSITHTNHVECNIKSPTGRIFVGAGEEVCSEGLEPEDTRGGTFLHLSPGYYHLTIALNSEGIISMNIESTNDISNKFNDALRL